MYSILIFSGSMNPEGSTRKMTRKKQTRKKKGKHPVFAGSGLFSTPDTLILSWKGMDKGDAFGCLNPT